MPTYLDLMGLKRDKKGQALCGVCGAAQGFGLNQAYRWEAGKLMCPRCFGAHSPEEEKAARQG